MRIGIRTGESLLEEIDVATERGELRQARSLLEEAFRHGPDRTQRVPRYLEENPQTVIAMAYFDLDLYEPTRMVLETIQPYLCAGSVLAFDQFGHSKWPGETAATRDVLSTQTRQLQLIPGFPTPAFLRWNGAGVRVT